jgi:putative transposase
VELGFVLAGKLLSPSRRRQCIDRVRQTLGVSERRACRTLGQHRSTQRKVPRGRPDEDRLTADIIELATQYGRYGYRPVTALLNQAGWHVNHKRVERIWQREGLKVPPKQKKRSRLWLNDGSCIRLRPERPNHVWSYDFVQDRTHDGRPYRILVILDEFSPTTPRSGRPTPRSLRSPSATALPLQPGIRHQFRAQGSSPSTHGNSHGRHRPNFAAFPGGSRSGGAHGP